MAYAYEVQVTVSDRPGLPTRIVARQEFAYDARDAALQAVLNQGAQCKLEGFPHAEIGLLSIGPPPEVRLAASEAVAEALHKAMRKMVDMGKEEKDR